MNGLTGEVSISVGPSDTAVAFGSGDVPVLATPRVLALAEAAAVAAVAGYLGAGKTSVGTHAEIYHVKATRLGGEVSVRAEVVDSTKRELHFEFTAREGDEVVAHGTHKRVIVDRGRFLS